MALILDGYSPAEIAELVHENPANVRSNLRHARSRLRQELQNPAADEKVLYEEKDKS
jgi:DNA-directed RNA polymerase specialized sigma24 family protein